MVLMINGSGSTSQETDFSEPTGRVPRTGLASLLRASAAKEPPVSGAAGDVGSAAAFLAGPVFPGHTAGIVSPATVQPSPVSSSSCPQATLMSPQSGPLRLLLGLGCLEFLALSPEHWAALLTSAGPHASPTLHLCFWHQPWSPEPSAHMA